MQQKAFTWVDFISPCGQHSLYIYNKVYASNGCTLFAYIETGTAPWCVYIIAGVGRLNVAYPYMGAMLRPENWDRRERDMTPTSFLFP